MLPRFEPMLRVFGLHIYREKDVNNFFMSLVEKDKEEARKVSCITDRAMKNCAALRNVRKYIESIKGNRNGKSYAYIPKIERIIEENVNKSKEWNNERI